SAAATASPRTPSPAANCAPPATWPRRSSPAASGLPGCHDDTALRCPHRYRSFLGPGAAPDPGLRARARAGLGDRERGPGLYRRGGAAELTRARLPGLAAVHTASV